MRRGTKIFWGTAALLIVSGAVSLLWWQGAFSPSPEAVIRDTLERANRGDYEGAVSNLTSNMRNSFWNTDPEIRKASLDAVTRHGEFKDVDVLKVEDFGHYSKMVRYRIIYQKGQSPPISELCLFERGRWRPIFKDTVATVAPDFNAWDPKDRRILPLAVSASTAGLQEAYTAVPGTRIRLRLPGDCQWDEQSADYHDKELHLVVVAVERSNQGFEVRLKGARSAWDGGPRRLSEETEAKVGGYKARLFRGEVIDAQGDRWHDCFLVFGTDTESVMVESRAPPVERLRELLIESLMTTKWDG
jgi:hypothetical protein